MTQSIHQKIKAEFVTEQALQQAKQALLNRGFLSVQTLSEPSITPRANAPQEETVKSGTGKAVIVGGLIGVILGTMMTAIALNRVC